MDLDSNWTQERVHSPPVGHISNDFDVDEFELEENEATEDEMIGDDVCSDSDELENEEGGSPAMCAPVRGMPSGVPLEVLHAMQTQGTLATWYLCDGEEYEGWGWIREAIVSFKPCISALSASSAAFLASSSAFLAWYSSISFSLSSDHFFHAILVGLQTHNSWAHTNTQLMVLHEISDVVCRITSHLVNCYSCLILIFELKHIIR